MLPIWVSRIHETTAKSVLFLESVINEGTLGPFVKAILTYVLFGQVTPFTKCELELHIGLFLFIGLLKTTTPPFWLPVNVPSRSYATKSESHLCVVLCNTFSKYNFSNSLVQPPQTFLKKNKKK